MAKNTKKQVSDMTYEGYDFESYEFQNAKDKILHSEPVFLEKAGRKGYICPKCGNGEGRDGTGIERVPRDTHWHCFRCGELHEDIMGLYAIYAGLDAQRDFVQIMEDLSEICEVPLPSKETFSFSRESREGIRQVMKSRTKTSKPEATKNRSKSRVVPVDSKDDDVIQAVVDEKKRELNAKTITEAQKYIDDPRAIAYLATRGLTLKTAKRFSLGFLPDWRHPDVPVYVKGSPRLIIPTGPYSYLARDIRAEIPDDAKKYAKQKAGVTRLFNLEALTVSDKPVFIVEGEIDALSIEQAGGHAVALGSTAMAKRLVEQVKLEKSEIKSLVLALDDDLAGKKAFFLLAEELQKLGISVSKVTFRGKGGQRVKDANEALVSDPEQFVMDVNEPERIAESISDILSEEQREYKSISNGEYLKSFKERIKARSNTPCISTGFLAVDDLLDGGLYEGLYTIGAISSLGKTSLILQIADQIARGGQDVLYFSLEMARDELMAKSISRHTYMITMADASGDVRDAKTTRGITSYGRYSDYTQKELEIIDRAFEAYGEYASHLYITEGIGTVGILQIREGIEQHMRLTKVRPVVIVDYLQIIAPCDPRATDKANMDMSMVELKRISRDAKIPVICISSFNRENYMTPVNLASFKESGAIEYSSDVVIGMQYAFMEWRDGETSVARVARIAKDRKSMRENSANGEPVDVQVCVLKNRNGKCGEAVLRYTPMFNYFDDGSGDGCKISSGMLDTEPLLIADDETIMQFESRS